MRLKYALLRSALVALMLAFVGTASFAQSLAVSTGKPVVDGVINANEYSFTQDFGQMKLYLHRTADTLYVGVVGNTSGWVAVGLDSLKMDASTIFMGYVVDGKAQFKPQVGMGHTHQDTAEKAITDSVISYAMKEDGGKTVLELALKAAPYISAGQKELDVIYAIGAAKAFTPYHSFRGSVKVPLS
jgi:multisubunit Na+/H+ antiporter MnhF subunit